MQYDPIRNVYIDTENGAIIPAGEGDDLRGIELGNMGEDFHMAASLQLESSGNLRQQGQYTSVDQMSSKPLGFDSLRKGLFTSWFAQTNTKTSVLGQLQRIQKSGNGTNAINVPEEGDADTVLARTLQFLEFEIENELYEQEGGDFQDKELKSSSCRRQLLTVSTLICVLQVFSFGIDFCTHCALQIGVMILMIQDDGYAPNKENPMIGPPPTTLVAKYYNFEFPR